MDASKIYKNKHKQHNWWDFLGVGGGILHHVTKDSIVDYVVWIR